MSPSNGDTSTSSSLLHVCSCYEDSLLDSSFSSSMAHLALGHCDVICNFSKHLKQVVGLEFDLPLVDSLSLVLLVIEVVPYFLNLLYPSMK